MSQYGGYINQIKSYTEIMNTSMASMKLSDELLESFVGIEEDHLPACLSDLIIPLYTHKLQQLYSSASQGDLFLDQQQKLALIDTKAAMLYTELATIACRVVLRISDILDAVSTHTCVSAEEKVALVHRLETYQKHFSQLIDLIPEDSRQPFLLSAMADYERPSKLIIVQLVKAIERGDLSSFVSG